MCPVRSLLAFFVAIGCFLILTVCPAPAQTAVKQIEHRSQVWLGALANVKLNGKWAAGLDVHYRAERFFASPSLMLVRSTANYSIAKNTTVGLGIALLEQAPTTPGWHTYSREKRLHQQMQFATAYGRWTLQHRWRNEQRWQQKIAGDSLTGSDKFTDRVRYMFTASYSLSSKPSSPQLVAGNEVMLQFGKEILYNTFDQNRIFCSYRQPIAKGIVADLGYLFIFQQKAAGNQYARFDNLRANLFYSF